MSEEMDKAECVQRKKEIINRVQYLEKLLSNPESYHLDIYKIKEFEKEIKNLMAEYKLLPEEVVIESTVHRETFYVGDRFVVKNGYLYEGSEAITKNIKFIDENTIECRKLIVSSDTLEPVEIVYRLKVVPKEIQPSKPVKMEKSCTIQEEGEGMMKTREEYLNPNGEYFRSLGLVFDERIGKWRRPTPDEYVSFSKRQLKKNKK